ncbi:MAG: 16S rRNA (guanine(527)-N(7))-methyltransferase RsmG [Myxococcota bacterium]
MEKSLEAVVTEGAAALGVEVSPEGVGRLLAYQAELLKWNARVNLTAITDPGEAAEKHLVDSLSVVPEVQGATDLLDLGAGAGLPGIPLAVALPALKATLVDAVEKKVAFVKAGAVKAGVAGRVRAVHARAQGRPEEETLPRASVVISRAFMDVGPFLQLAKAYLAPGGRVVAMLGRAPPDDELWRVASAAGFMLGGVRRFALPFSGAPRGVAVFHVEQ